MLALVLSKKQIDREDKSTLFIVETNTKNTVFVSEEEFNNLKVGSTVVVNTTKYKNKEGKWRSNSSLIPVTI